ncbi:hypothetical protein [Lysinibacillus fusiformis]|uniref:hypothetical protein n=1 Tax=Lysinibacillus fusiformis TaxID=28031 RepID=UPI0021C06AF8|nr:hypothetical protein [Lysinibacillus fusiformis]UXJ71333.1 hypothetical protein N5069_24150 [Lysinibacillus fusiformis]
MKIEKEEVIAGVTGAGIGVASVGVGFIGANAAAMSSGLAATGAIVGGGMALGIVVVSAAPLLLGATGFAAVKGYKKYKAKNK